VATWATIEDLADWLGIPVNDRMETALAVSQAACEHIRPDLVTAAAYTENITYEGIDPFVDTVGADVSHAVILYAALIYRERTSPQGISTYENFDAAQADFGSAVYNIRQLLGSRKPVAR
jgi:hypothetical protein